MLVLLETIGEYHKIENKSKFRGKLPLQDFFIVHDCFISGKFYFIQSSNLFA